MFKSYYLKLRHMYDELVAKTYAHFLLTSPWTLMLTYLIFATLLSCGLLTLRLDPSDPESLTYVRNSQALRNFDLLNRTFNFYQYDRNFANKQLYLGYYVEIICTARMPNASHRLSNDDLFKPEFNLLNRYIHFKLITNVSHHIKFIIINFLLFFVLFWWCSF